MPDTTALMASLPTDALRQAFVEYDEEIDHPAQMSDDYINYMVEEGHLGIIDRDQFQVWKKEFGNV